MARPRRQHLLATLLAALTLAACTSGGSAPSPTFSPVSSTPSASASSLSPEDQAKQAAREVIAKYYDTIPRCLADPTHTVDTCFDDVAISTELLDLRNMLNAARQVNARASGAVRIVSVEYVQMDLTNKVQETPPTVPKVTFRVCADVSAFDLLGPDGKSVRAPTRIPRTTADLTAVNYHFPEPGEWRVGYQDKAGAAC